MTSPTLTQRLLGASREVECPTSVFFALTGNNLGLGADELTRWMVCRLAPVSPRPELRNFKHPDIVQHGRSIRMKALQAVTGIIAGYLHSDVKIASRSRFPQWDRMVRQPLIWAGASDVAEGFGANAANSEEALAHRGLLLVLHELFGEQEFMAHEVADWARPGGPDCFSPSTARVDFFPEPDEDPLHQPRLVAALTSLRAKDPTNQQSIGRVLRAHAGRPTYLDEAETRLARIESRPVHGLMMWRVRLGA